MPGATVTAACGAFRRQRGTASDGTFSLDLPPGAYHLRVESPGFDTFEQIVSVAADRDTVLDVTLTVARIADAVTVHASSPVATRSIAATKTDTPLIETPQSISIVTRDLLDARGATTLNEALGYTAGVKPEVYGADPRYDWLGLRGFEAYSPGYFRDGLHARNNGAYSVWRMDPYGVEQIEVMRGPASVLYGQNSPGGLVNVVSKRPPATTFGEVQLQTGSFGRLQGAADLGGPIDEQGRLRYRLTGLARNSDFQVDFVEDDRLFVAPALAWQPSAATTVTFLGHYQRERTGSGINFFPPEGTLLANPNGRIPRHRFSGEQSFEGFEKDEWAIASLLEHRLNRVWRLRQNVRYGAIDLDYAQVYGTGLDAADPTGRLLTRSAFSSRERVHAFTIDHQAQAVFVTGPIRHTMLAGIDYQRHEFDQRSAVGAAPPLDLFTPVYGQPIEEPTGVFADAVATLSQTGLYFQDQMNVQANGPGHWVVLLGGRYDRTGIDTDDRLSNARPEQDDDKFTGRAGLVYLSSAGVAPYVSYAESFFPVSGIDPESHAPFEPETGKQVEAGVKYQPTGQHGFVSVAAFDLRRQNYLTTDPITFVPRQTGEIRSRGMEIEAAAGVMPGLDVTAAYTWLRDFEITRSSDPAELHERHPTVPAHMASLWAHYRFADGLLAGAGVGGGLRYVGSTFGDIANSRELTVPSYTLLDLALTYQLAAWRLAINVRNLADKTYVSCWTSCYYGSSRNLTATVSYRW